MKEIKRIIKVVGWMLIIISIIECINNVIYTNNRKKLLERVESVTGVHING